jgi:hypothetical protein
MSESMTDSGACQPATDEPEPMLIVGNNEHNYMATFSMFYFINLFV